jgi:DNA-binding PadR family transcriptional regulator
MALVVKGLSKNYVFNWDSIAQETCFDDSIVIQILNDFVKDGLLMISARLPDTTVYAVTDRGNICFQKIINRYKEKGEEFFNHGKNSNNL